MRFNVHGSVHRKYIPIYIQQDATLHSLFIYGNCSTCFGWYLHPSSGAHTTVSTASDICHTITATCCYSLAIYSHYIIFQYISNKMQHYTLYFIWKLLYMFRVVPPTIVRSVNNCIYSIWYLSHHYCYLPQAAKCAHRADQGLNL